VRKLNGDLKYGWNSFDEIDGGSIQADSLNNFTIFVSELTSSKRDRFTIAHELGHLVLHLQMIKKEKPDAGMRATRHVDSSNENLQRAEWEANWFAAQLLMPRREFKRCVDTFGVDHAAKVFNVSAKAAEIRAQSLG
jgi:Zn-dependent peptidase ImmA (M78 family)